MPKYIFVSVETTGLPTTNEVYLDFVCPGTLRFWDSSRLLQICWSLTDDKYVMFQKMFYTNPKVVITPKTTEQTGMTQITVSHSMDMKTVLSMFIDDIRKYNCNYIVGHNVDFDLSVIGSEMIRCGMSNEKRFLENQEYYCTMKSFPLFDTEQSRKLRDRYYFCFNVYPSLEHDARDEVCACIKVFFKLKQLSELINCRE
jgi:DNA polymerase III epsilon subunit-like protein